MNPPAAAAPADKANAASSVSGVKREALQRDESGSRQLPALITLRERLLDPGQVLSLAGIPRRLEVGRLQGPANRLHLGRAVERISEATLLEDQLVHLAVLPGWVEAHVHV